jgi:hypothetical protein
MQEIKLTQGKLAIVDDDDFERLNAYKWHAVKACNTFYAERNASKKNGRTGKTILMHREIIATTSPILVTDHIDGDGLNNQKSNLRVVSRRQNCQNRINKPGTSKYPGVDWISGKKRWRARIEIDGTRKALGTFSVEENAFLAYRAAVEQTGERIL